MNNFRRPKLGLQDCRLSGANSRAELLIVEGDSASQAVCVLRDPDVPNWPEIMSVDRVTGDTGAGLRLRARSIEHFERVIDALAEFGRPSSSMVLSTPLRWKPVERFTNDSNPATQA